MVCVSVLVVVDWGVHLLIKARKSRAVSRRASGVLAKIWTLCEYSRQDVC